MEILPRVPFVLSGRVLARPARESIRISVNQKRFCQSETVSTGPTDFGLFFDIDGVITRGRTLLPHSKAAFKLLTDENGRFTVPTIFVTNAGNSMRQRKAKQLSDWLDIKIEPDQVVMSHSPLKMFKQSLNKHMLISGQGPIEEIAANLGFTRFTTMEEFTQCFPQLDTVDHKRRKPAPCAFEKFFPKIEGCSSLSSFNSRIWRNTIKTFRTFSDFNGIILFGEPVRWETSLQLIVDVLMTDGRPSEATAKIPYPHLPILACNMDLVWMSEAPMPRFGHGSFMTCLEALYNKITGYQLKYAAQVGKPSEITYHYAERILQAEARLMGLPRIKRMYCIGDNPAVDIYGANLFNKRIQRKIAKTESSVQEEQKLQQLQMEQAKQMEQPRELLRVSSSGRATRHKEDPTLPSTVHQRMAETGTAGSSMDYSRYGGVTGGGGAYSGGIGGGVYGSNNGGSSMRAVGGSKGGATIAGSLEYVLRGPSSLSDNIEDDLTASIESCESILVCTGVFDENRAQLRTDHVMDDKLCIPSVTTVHNVLEAISAVMEKEGVNVPK